MTEEEKRIVIELICNEQNRIIAESCENYELVRYKKFEELKVKIKRM